jgi:hypothetical protein
VCKAIASLPRTLSVAGVAGFALARDLGGTSGAGAGTDGDRVSRPRLPSARSSWGHCDDLRVGLRFAPPIGAILTTHVLLEKRDFVVWLLTGIALTATLFGIVVGSD